MFADGDELKAPAGKAVGRNPVGRGTEKSDEGVIPKNPLKAAAEAREGRPKTKGEGRHKGHTHIGVSQYAHVLPLCLPFVIGAYPCFDLAASLTTSP